MLALILVAAGDLIDGAGAAVGVALALGVLVLAPVEGEGGEHLAAPQHDSTAVCSDHGGGSVGVIDVGDEVALALPGEVPLAHVTPLKLVRAVLVLTAWQLLHYFLDDFHWRLEFR